MFKKGQFTILAIIGIFALILVIILITMKPNIVTDNFSNSVAVEKEKVRSLVQSCLEIVSKEALLISNMQGGSVNLLENFLAVGPVATSFLLFNEVANSLDKEQMEKDLSKYVETQVKNCVEFSPFQNTNIDVGEIKATTRIEDDLVTISLDWPIELTKDGSTAKISKFDTHYKITLKDMIETVNKILGVLASNPSYLNLGVLGGLNKVSDLNLKPEGESFTFLNRDKNTNIDNNTFSFMFATQPRLQEENLPPEIEEIPKLRGEENERFTYQVKASDPENDSIFFVLTSPLTNIDPNTGVIDFTPTREDIGNHSLLVVAIDDNLNRAEKIIDLEIGGVNQPPEIHVENQKVLLNDLLEYSPSVFYIGPSLSFELLNAPTGAIIDVNTGIITWTASELGVHQFIFEASNFLHTITESFEVNVTEYVNNPPHVYAPDQTLGINEKLDNNKIMVIDEEEDDVTIEIITPTNAVVRNNLIDWSSTTRGTFIFNVTFSDGENNVRKVFNVEVV